ncbi:SUKH-4 family immunity protein [Streptomyces sp. NPDC005573]|uniref:SUKH-4 family immunity protein n=1 Tax=unclassified Streptomyces TaxID=2593676 RepID=UPI0033BC725C
MTPADMLAAYGLAHVVYYPRSSAGEGADPRVLDLLGSVGLPDSEVFTVKEDPESPYEPGFDPTVIGGHFDHYGFSCPEESRDWWLLGIFFTSLIALDPVSGKVYAFPESEEHYIPLHRDLESLLFSLVEFRKLEVDHDNDVDPEELAERFRRVVGAFDPTPFADEESQWNLALEELENGIW